MAAFQLLEQSQEDELHKARLLNVEEKPFKRITKRLLTPGSLLSTPTILPPTPPPDAESDYTPADHDANAQKVLDERRQFREEVLLDFAAFDSSIARIQFLRNSNAQERERYAAEKLEIVETAQGVRDSTTNLRVQLEGARATLNQRKKFDELADKITSNRLLRPREDQQINLLKLEEECRELERESEAYATTWRERREQFERIVQEGEQMRRLIRDEKEEVERREGMEGEEEDGEVGSRGGQTPKHSSQSGAATPRNDDANTPRPMSSNGGQTPAHGEENGSGLRPKPLPAGSLSRPTSRIGSRLSSPVASDRKRAAPEEVEDISMDDAKVQEAEAPADIPMGDGPDVPTGELDNDTPEVKASEPAEDTMDTT